MKLTKSQLKIIHILIDKGCKPIPGEILHAGKKYVSLSSITKDIIYFVSRHGILRVGKTIETSTR